MKIYKYNIKQNEYEFICQSFNTRSGFGHHVTMFKNGAARSEEKRYYYNRTWECFQYQSAMLGAIRNVMEGRRERIKEEFKNQKGIKRLTQKYQEEYDAAVKNDEAMIEWGYLYAQVKGGNY